MSTVKNRPDPFRYGWRDVQRVGRNGRKEWVQIPLTLEDVLHPQEGDVIPLTTVHQKIVKYLIEVLPRRLAANRRAVVLCDQLIFWDIPGLRQHSPDFAVIFGVDADREWRVFRVAEEGVRPSLIIEVTSDDTRVNDVVTKVDHYYRARVPVYVIVDVQERRGVWTVDLIGYRRGARRYVRMRPDAQGRLPLKALGLTVAVEGARVRCYDAVTGDPMLDDQELDKARRAAEAKAARESRARKKVAKACEAAEARVRELEAELQRLRGESSTNGPEG